MDASMPDITHQAGPADTTPMDPGALLANLAGALGQEECRRYLAAEVSRSTHARNVEAARVRLLAALSVAGAALSAAAHELAALTLGEAHDPAFDGALGDDVRRLAAAAARDGRAAGTLARTLCDRSTP